MTPNHQRRQDAPDQKTGIEGYLSLTANGTGTRHQSGLLVRTSRQGRRTDLPTEGTPAVQYGIDLLAGAGNAVLLNSLLIAASPPATDLQPGGNALVLLIEDEENLTVRDSHLSGLKQTHFLFFSFKKRVCILIMLDNVLSVFKTQEKL